MPENLFETRYDLTKKSKLREFYDSNKILIYSSILSLIIIIASYSYYQSSQEKKKISLSDDYIQAKVYLDAKKELEALEILKNIVFSNDSTYSTLSFFMILNANLINDNEKSINPNLL